MTCQECELALAGEDRVAGVEEHLATCAACGEFAVELRSNAGAMLALAAESMPPVRRPQPVRWPARLTWVAAAAAIAAMILLTFAIPKERTPSRSRLTGGPAIAVNGMAPVLQMEPVKTHKPRRVPRKNVQPEILQVKMLTDDPSVVIYWQIESKKGTE